MSVEFKATRYLLSEVVKIISIEKLGDSGFCKCIFVGKCCSIDEPAKALNMFVIAPQVADGWDMQTIDYKIKDFPVQWMLFNSEESAKDTWYKLHKNQMEYEKELKEKLWDSLGVDSKRGKIKIIQKEKS